MDDFIAFGPILAVAGLCAVGNIVYCYCGIRRLRSLEYRLYTLEQIQVTTGQQEQGQQPSTVYPPVSYVQPNLYTYAQPQQQPSAPMYYSQDPQAIQTARTQIQGTYQYS